jgi:hypothetical protein
MKKVILAEALARYHLGQTVEQATSVGRGGLHADLDGLERTVEQTGKNSEGCIKLRQKHVHKTETR